MKFVHISLALMFWVGAAAAQTAPLPKIEHPNVDLSAGMPGTKMLPGTLDMTQVLKDDAGKPIIDQYLQEPTDPTCGKCGSLTLGHAIAHALFTAFPDEKDLSGEQKWARGALAEQLENNSKAQLSAAQVVVIKRLLGKLYNGVIITRVYPMIDPGAAPPPVQ